MHNGKRISLSEAVGCSYTEGEGQMPIRHFLLAYVDHKCILGNVGLLLFFNSRALV